MKTIALITALGLVSATLIAGNSFEFNRSLNLSTERLTALEVDSGSGSLEITGTSGNEILVEATIVSDDYRSMDNLVDAFEDKMTLELVRESEYAVLRAVSANNWGKSPDIQIHLKVQVPKGMDLMVDDGSGPTRIEDINGEVEVDDGSGPMTLINIGNNVVIDDGSGSLFIDGVNGDLDIDDGSGSVEIKDVNGSIDIEDGSGEILAKNIGGDFTVDDGSGSIVVKDLQGSFKLIDGGSGSITVNGEKWSKK